MKRVHYDPYSSLNQRLIDLVIAGIALYLAYQIRFDWHVPPESDFQMWLLLPVLMLGRIAANSLLGTYRLIWRYIGLADALQVTRNYIAFSALLLALRLWLPPKFAWFQLPLSIITMEFFLSVAAALGARALRRMLSEGIAAKTLNGHRGKRILLVGAGRAGARVARELAGRAELTQVGFLDDDPKKIGTVINGLRVLGPVESLEEVICRHRVEEVVISLAQPPLQLLKRVWACGEATGIRVKSVPTLEEILRGTVNIAAFRNVQMEDLLGREPVELVPDDPVLASTYSGKRILVTGAGGSIGSELAYRLASLNPARLILLDKDENGLHDTFLRLAGCCQEAQISLLVADIRFRARLEEAFARFRPEIVFHAAAHKHVYLMEMNPSEAILNNVGGTRNLIECSVAHGSSRFVLISTDKAVRPTSIMGSSKRVCELLVRAHRDRGARGYCCVRFGNVVGSRGSVIPTFQKQILNGGPITITHRDAERYLMTIPEAVCLLVQAGTLAERHGLFVLDMGEPVLIRNLARDFIERSGLQPERDIRIEVTNLRPGEKLREELVQDNREVLEPTRFAKVRAIEENWRSVGTSLEMIQALEEAARNECWPEIRRILGALEIGYRGQDPVKGAVVPATATHRSGSSAESVTATVLLGKPAE